MPDFDAQHEGFERVGFDEVGGGVVGVGGSHIRRNDDHVQRVDHLVVEGDHQGDDDRERQKSADQRPILGLLSVTQKLGRVEEISLIDEVFDIGENSHLFYGLSFLIFIMQRTWSIISFQR